jgi:hypothetical protein
VGRPASTLADCGRHAASVARHLTFV